MEIIHKVIGHFEGGEDFGTPIKYISDGTLCGEKSTLHLTLSADTEIVNYVECLKIMNKRNNDQ